MNLVLRRLCLVVLWFGFLSGLALGNPINCLNHFKCEIGNDKKTVWCSDRGIDVVPECLNPSLLSLSLHNTKIHMLYITSFKYYTEIRYINLSNNTITKIGKKAFENQLNLEKLYLDNNKISNLDVNIFFKLRNLTILSLQGNLLESLPEEIFHELTSLKYLDLSHNRITSLEDRIFGGLSNLLGLNLAQNKLSFIPSASFDFISHLSDVSLGGNAFQNIESSDFKYLTALNSLDLSSTDLQTVLGPSTFQSIWGLRKLKLNDCRLSAIPTTSLLSLTQLEEIELSRNLFDEVPKDAFKTNTRLKSVKIVGCPSLTRISPGAFDNNLNIIHLNVSRNPNLAFLPPKEFKALSQLSSVDLHGNNLQYIPEDLISWREVNVWLLHYNPIVCNCSIAWLRLLLIDSNSSFPSIQCKDPPQLKGVSIASLELTELRCGLDATTQGIVIAFSVCFVVLVVACVVVILLYRHRDSCVRRLLKRRRKWQSTSPNHRSYDSDYPCIKPVPVTEL